MNPLSASQSTVCGLAWKRYSRQTPLRDVAPALNGPASLAKVRPCRTGAASFMEARARGRARRRASSAAGGQIGNTGTFRGKPRRNGRACARHYLRSAICATRSKGPCTAPDNLSHWHPVLAHLYDRAGRADDAQGLPCAIRSDRGSGQNAVSDPSAHAAAWLRLSPSQRRPRHTGATGLARPQKHPAHGALHRAGAG